MLPFLKKQSLQIIRSTNKLLFVRLEQVVFSPQPKQDFARVNLTHCHQQRSLHTSTSLLQAPHNPVFIAMTDNRFCIDYAKRQAGCKKCKQKIEKGELRIAKITASPFSDDGEMKNYHHPACIFETFRKARATTKVIEDPSDLEGWSEIQQSEKDVVMNLIKEHEAFSDEKKKGTPKKKAETTPKKTKQAAEGTPKKKAETTPKKTKQVAGETPKKKENGAANPGKNQDEDDAQIDVNPGPSTIRAPVNPGHKDNSFREFRRLCAKIADTPGYLDKSAIVEKFLSKGTGGDSFQGDLQVWVRLLLPGVVKRVYNMQSRQMIKVFSRIFSTDEEEMLDDLSQGDVAETIGKFYEQSQKMVPPKKSDLSVHDVDNFLDELTKLSKEDEQQFCLKKVVAKCTTNDLKMFIRLMKGDLRIQAGAKHILDGVHSDAYNSFNATRNIVAVVDKVLEVRSSPNPKTATLNLGASLMQPVQPMLAQACKSVEMAFQKCPNGIYSEIKYDGERVQLHKQGANFKYFSRSLKPVMAHKVKHFAEHIPKAFPSGSNLILDAEVLMVDNKTGNPLPFGTLGIHKGSGFKDASPCLFVFDLMYYNGENLMDKPMKRRRQLLEEVMVEVGNKVKLSELNHVTRKSQLVDQIKTVLDQGLEGLVLKDLKSTYEPGKRHWLKVKKDYLNEGAMADTADLVVLGGWFGTGQKGGLISIFLMGCLDTFSGKWCTVTKVHTGHDDATLERLQGELLPGMELIKKDWDRVPIWLKINRQMVPDYLARDPKKSPVWEITGAEFSKAELHTAGGISIRFPRVTKIRSDKNYKTATNLKELKHLYTESKNNIDLEIQGGSDDNMDTEEASNNNKNAKKRAKDITVKQTSSPGATPAKKKKSDLETSPKKEEKPLLTNSVKMEAYDYDTDEDEKPPLANNVKNEAYDYDTDEDEKPPLPNSVKEDYEYDSDDKLMMSGEDAIPSDTKNISDNLNELRTSSGFCLKEMTGDLFTCPVTSSLAHCISRDYRLGKGIAKLFREKFGRVDELKRSGADIGGLALFKDGQRFIYNLVTKEVYKDKPTYETLRLSLEEMKKHALANGVESICMPRIGCGLDGLNWSTVRILIKNVFQLENIKITVYNLESSQSVKAVSKDGPRTDKLVKTPTKASQPSVSSMFEKKKQKKLTDVGFGFSTTNPLPDIFVGVKALLQPGVDNVDEMRRYLIAYGGLDEDSFQEGQETHVIYPEGGVRGRGEATKGVKHVSDQWLVDSIKLKKVQDERLYKI